MGWIKQTEKPCEHKDRPNLPVRYNSANAHMVGDIWGCDDCKQRFTIATYVTTEGDFRETWNVTKYKWTETRPEVFHDYR